MRYLFWILLGVIFLANAGCHDYAQAEADRNVKVQAEVIRLKKEMEESNKPITATILEIYGGLQMTGVPEHHSVHSSSNDGLFSQSSSRSESFSNETVKIDCPLVLKVETEEEIPRILCIEVTNSDTATKHSLYPLVKDKGTKIRFPAGNARKIARETWDPEIVYYDEDLDNDFNEEGMQAGKKLARRIEVLNPK